MFVGNHPASNGVVIRPLGYYCMTLNFCIHRSCFKVAPRLLTLTLFALCSHDALRGSNQEYQLDMFVAKKWIRDLIASLPCLKHAKEHSIQAVIHGGSAGGSHTILHADTSTRASCTICAPCKQTGHATSNSVSCKQRVHANKFLQTKVMHTCSGAAEAAATAANSQACTCKFKFRGAKHAQATNYVCRHAGKPDNMCVQTCNVQGHKTCRYVTAPVVM